MQGGAARGHVLSPWADRSRCYRRWTRSPSAWRRQCLRGAPVISAPSTAHDHDKGPGSGAGCSLKSWEEVVRMRGLEPPRELPHSDLNAARLPVPPHPHVLAGGGLLAKLPHLHKRENADPMAKHRDRPNISEDPVKPVPLPPPQDHGAETQRDESRDDMEQVGTRRGVSAARTSARAPALPTNGFGRAAARCILHSITQGTPIPI